MIKMRDRFLRELRCPHCHRLLGKEYIINGYLEVKCGGCSEVSFFEFKYYKNFKRKNDKILIKQKAAASNTLKAEKGNKENA